MHERRVECVKRIQNLREAVCQLVFVSGSQLPPQILFLITVEKLKEGDHLGLEDVQAVFGQVDGASRHYRLLNLEQLKFCELRKVVLHYVVGYAIEFNHAADALLNGVCAWPMVLLHLERRFVESPELSLLMTLS